MVYLILYTYDMTPLSSNPSTLLLYVCITIIDTIILTIHTNDAYIFDTAQTPPPSCAWLKYGTIWRGLIPTSKYLDR
jgi:hypothetical protein